MSAERKLVVSSSFSRRGPHRASPAKSVLFSRRQKASLSTKGGKTEPRRRPCWASKGNTNASSIESRPLLSSNFCDDSLFLSLSLSLKEALSLKVVVVVGKRRRRPSSSFSSFVSPVLLSRRKAKPTTPTTPKTERKRATLFGGLLRLFFCPFFCVSFVNV